jgi:hypothetical protein
MLKYDDMVIRDMPLLSSSQKYMQYVNPCLLQRMNDEWIMLPDAPYHYLTSTHDIFWSSTLSLLLMWCPPFFWFTYGLNIYRQNCINNNIMYIQS